VERSYAKAIAKEVKSLIVDPDPDLPSAHAGETEGAYNDRAAATLNPLAAPLDRQFTSATDNQDNIEFCDLLQAGRIVHVKKRSSSSTLSHLFQQGLVSADLFQTDPGFRTRIHSKVLGLQAQHGFNPGITTQLGVAAVDPNQFEIRYAVIGAKPKAGRSFLPFFSQVTAVRAAAELRARGFKVSLTRVPIT
jgi:uncharacterized protein (TIGR04141 family)